MSDDRIGVPSVCLVIPTVGRPSLTVLLNSIAAAAEPPAAHLPARIVVVDDRAGVPRRPVLTASDVDARLRDRLVVRRSGVRGPAAARNAGWRAGACDCSWVAFVDDDVVVSADWLAELAVDLSAAAPAVGGVQGQVSVPLPAHRRPTDWERGTAGLASSRWITADMAYRRAALDAVGGFDERFPRAFREDADLALRVQAAGWQLTCGRRRITHPVRPAAWNASLRQQRGNADDPLMRRLHGRGWGKRADAPPGRRIRHAAIAGAGAAAFVGAALRRPKLAGAGLAGWVAGTAEFAYARISPGPRNPRELATMAATSVLIPPAAIGHWVAGVWRWHRAAAWMPPPRPPWSPAAVLFDRDGTLVRDVPYNGDPERVELMPDAMDVIADLRAAGVPVGVITNQSGIARGLLTEAQVEAVHARIEQLAGPIGAWCVCPHGPDDGCDCRKPAPGLIRDAADRLGVPAEGCVVIGDIGSDLAAAAAAGARAILVPTEATLPAEAAASVTTCFTLSAAVGLVLSTCRALDQRRLETLAAGSTR
jgi:histidinol-phosphate phosphatase family protein